MTNNRSSIRIYVDRLIEVDRLNSEGATLKNVSENMRALAVFVLVFVAVKAMWQSPNYAVNLAAIFWGIWTCAYAIMASLQCGILLMSAIGDALPWIQIRQSNQFVQGLILLALSAMMLVFVVTAFIFLSTTIQISSGKP